MWRLPLPLSRLAKGYDGLLNTHPYLTKAAGTGVTFIASDCTAQAIEEFRREPGAPMPEPEDRLFRSLKFGAVGALWIGPGLSFWFDMMDKLVPGRSPRAVATKLIIDQCVMAPPMLASMFCWTALAQGASFDDIRVKLETQLASTWRSGLCVWTPVSLFQQVLVPLQYRVSCSNLVSYFWDTYLSLQMMKAPTKAPEVTLQMMKAPPKAPEVTVT
ncbi:hypothetical protein M885DRAFT_472562 [Pelagophyceae sp. CCMP2097]|nr:hypothetical protein M885DRAFT_472562 [Pelagophyceae sp. CCMP2097]